MAKDDYFVIMYKILSYLYECMKKGEKPNIDFISYEKFKIPESYYNHIVINMIEKEYIKGAITVPILGQDCGIRWLNPYITQEGVEFLTENSTMKKVKDVLGKALDFVPGLI